MRQLALLWDVPRVGDIVRPDLSCMVIVSLLAVIRPRSILPTVRCRRKIVRQGHETHVLTWAAAAARGCCCTATVHEPHRGHVARSGGNES